MKTNTKEVVIAGLMIALSFLLSLPIFKVMAGSIGFDAVPAFFTAATIGPMMGGFVGALAHMITAIFTGFPFTLPVHIAVMIMMFVTCYAYGYARVRTNRYIAGLIGVVINGPINLAVAAAMSQALGLGFAGMTMFIALVGPLTIVAAINVVIAEVLVSLVGNRVLVTE